MNVVQECACGSRQGGLHRGDSFECTPHRISDLEREDLGSGPALLMVLGKAHPALASSAHEKTS